MWQIPVPVWMQGRYDIEYVKERGTWKMKHLKMNMRMVSPHADGWVKTMKA